MKDELVKAIKRSFERSHGLADDDIEEKYWLHAGEALDRYLDAIAISLPASSVSKSVLQDWVNALPLRQQGVLVLALRGPDGERKESGVKPLVRVVRALLMNSGREGGPMRLEGTGMHWPDDTFMNTQTICIPSLWDEACKAFFNDWDGFNIHFVQHIIHAFAVIGMNHPNEMVQDRMWKLYETSCRKLHMKPESTTEIKYRLRSGKRDEEDE